MPVRAHEQRRLSVGVTRLDDGVHTFGVATLYVGVKPGGEVEGL